MNLHKAILILKIFKIEKAEKFIKGGIVKNLERNFIMELHMKDCNPLDYRPCKKMLHHLLKPMALFILVIFGSNCFVFKSLTSFGSHSSYRASREKPLEGGKIASVFINNLSYYQYYDEQLLATAVDKAMKNKFKSNYMTTGETRSKMFSGDCRENMEKIHAFDSIILAGMREDLNRVQRCLGVSYMVVLLADEVNGKFRYDYGYIFGPGAFYTGTEGGYGRNFLLSLALLDLNKPEVLFSEYNLDMTSQGEAPNYHKLISGFAGNAAGYLKRRLK